jgi:hypothetical protein
MVRRTGAVHQDVDAPKRLQGAVSRNNGSPEVFRIEKNLWVFPGFGALTVWT